MKLVLKLDENGNAVVVKGKVVYVDEDDDNKEYPLDPPSMYSKITDLGKENKIHRQKVKELDEKFKAFADIEDLEAWQKEATEAIETVANYNDKDFIEIGKVEKLKGEMKDAYEAKLAAKDTKAATVAQAHADALSKKDASIRKLMISNRFSVSPHFSGEKSITTMPPDVAEAFFGKHFKVEEADSGDLVLRAYMGGEEITSLQNPGEPAGFEESLGIIIDKYPNKANILRAPGGGSGGGGGHGSDLNSTDKLTVLKQQLEDATKAGDMTKSIALKNQIFKLSNAS